MDEFAPSLRAALPDGWHAKESLTLLAPDGQANVIASSEPLLEHFDAYYYAEQQGTLLRAEFPGYEEREYGPWLVFGGRPGYRRVFQWKPPDAEPVVQIQLYYARAGRGYTATATTPAVQYARYSEVLQASLERLHLERATDAVPTP
jgi:hypothetical protein